jgi:hypothetical protein
MWAALLAEEHPDKVAVLVAEVEAGREQIALAASVLAGEVQACDGYVDRCSRVVDLRAAFRAARLRRGRAWRG